MAAILSQIEPWLQTPCAGPSMGPDDGNRLGAGERSSKGVTFCS